MTVLDGCIPERSTYREAQRGAAITETRLAHLNERANVLIEALLHTITRAMRAREEMQTAATGAADCDHRGPQECLGTGRARQRSGSRRGEGHPRRGGQTGEERPDGAAQLAHQASRKATDRAHGPARTGFINEMFSCLLSRTISVQHGRVELSTTNEGSEGDGLAFNSRAGLRSALLPLLLPRCF